jgi:hypothetical protein
LKPTSNSTVVVPARIRYETPGSPCNRPPAPGGPSGASRSTSGKIETRSTSPIWARRGATCAGQDRSMRLRWIAYRADKAPAAASTPAPATFAHGMVPLLLPECPGRHTVTGRQRINALLT